ncbi:MAG: NADH-quinone oxidoreductase subunit L [Acidimicrobiia bacterium]|nr:NADH-quinone oxidoreductase subunit L [Acidimicrobiia bacterium]
MRQVPLFTWFATGTFSVDLGFTIDRLTAIFCLNVTGIGFLIHMYSSAYMKEDEGYFKFMSYLNLFLFSMLMLIMGENLLLMFVGWEGVGLCSYLLIGFWYTDHANADAGKKAFITNRIGDFGFLLGMFFILYALNSQGLPMSLSFHELQANAGKFAELATIIGLLLFVGAAGKSAQVPLYVWLPDAMAGPTPVSALIHAATMVTAGIYMVARMNFIYVQSPMAMTVVTAIGAITALYAATMGFAQNDIKKVLAYSTVSQLGYMFMGVGVGAYAAGLFHVITHAFFKACLFLGSGSVIHALHHEQDIRKMGGLLKKMPITGWTFALSTAAIAGVPLLSGFFSKDEILWKVFSNQTTLIPGWVFWLVGVAGAMCTAFYMVRVYALTFTGTYRGAPEEKHGHDAHANDDHGHGHHGGVKYDDIRESPWGMTLPLVVLAIGAVFGGLLGLPHWLPGHPTNQFDHWLGPVFESARGLKFLDNTSLELGLMVVSVGLAALSALFAWHMYVGKGQHLPAQLAERIRPVYTLVFNKYYVDELYAAVIVRPIKTFARFSWRVIDDGLIDGVLVNGPANLVHLTGRLVRLFTTGDVQRYAFFVLGGVWLLVVVWLAE